MNNPAKVKEAGQKSKEYALKHYDWDDITRRIEGVYKDVLARRHRQNK
jgi:glycosyltransferase involved in cell wall biosynthesis